MIVIGIDPGITGAMAIWRCERLTEVCDLPTSGGMIDPAVLAAMLRASVGDDPLAVAVVELQGIRPGTAAGAGGKSMRGFGRIEGVLAALSIPIAEEPAPAAWKRRCGVGKVDGGGNQATRTRLMKEAARARASQLMPAMASNWPLAKHHGRAEAALLAWYGAHFVAPASVPTTRRGEPTSAARSTT